MHVCVYVCLWPHTKLNLCVSSNIYLQNTCISNAIVMVECGSADWEDCMGSKLLSSADLQ